MYRNIIPATKHLILLGAFSKDILLLFVPALAGNFLLLLEMEYLADVQFDALHVQDVRVADSAANVQAFEKVVGLKSQLLALRFVLLENKGAALELELLSLLYSIDFEVQSDLLHAHSSLFYALLWVKQLAVPYEVIPAVHLDHSFF